MSICKLPECTNEVEQNSHGGRLKLYCQARCRNTNVSRLLRARKKETRVTEMVVCGLPECNREFGARGNKMYCCANHVKNANHRMRIYGSISLPVANRVCGLNGCYTEFIATHASQLYCCPAHRNKAKKVVPISLTRHDELTYLMFSPGLNTRKIGRTNNLTVRTMALRNGCWDIELITTFPHGRNLERYLHTKFADTRIPGTEWFTDLTEVDVKNAVAEYELELAS